MLYLQNDEDVGAVMKECCEYFREVFKIIGNPECKGFCNSFGKA